MRGEFTFTSRRAGHAAALRLQAGRCRRWGGASERGDACQTGRRRAAAAEAEASRSGGAPPRDPGWRPGTPSTSRRGGNERSRNGAAAAAAAPPNTAALISHRHRWLAGASSSSGREANSSGEGGNGKDGGAAECASVSLQKSSSSDAALGSDLASLTCGPLVKSATSFFFTNLGRNRKFCRNTISRIYG